MKLAVASFIFCGECILIEEPVGGLGGPRPPTPIIPYYKANGNEVVEQWYECFVDRAGNEATLTRVRYKHKKKAELNEAVIRVKWTKLNFNK